MTYREIAAAQLKVDEGWRRKVYKDTVGKLSIGCGRNLDDVGLRDDEIAYLLANDLLVAEDAAKRLFQSFDRLSDARKAVLLNMALNLGEPRLAGFKQTIAAVEAQDWAGAAKAMLSSRWANQVGERARRLAKIMEEG